jgi:hypothetical protein
MTRISRSLLIAEIFVCFAPVTALLSVGAVMVPFQFYAIALEPLLWEGPAGLVACVTAGLIGLCTLLFVLSRLLSKPRPFERPVRILIGVLIGAAPLFYFALSGDGPMLIVVILPLLSTAHVLYLSRHMFMPALGDLDRPWGRGHAVVVGVASLVAALGFTYVAGVDSSDDELVKRREAWVIHKPAAYSYHIHIAGWVTPNLLLPRKVTVRGSHVVSAAYDLGPHPPAGPLPPPEEKAWSMEMIFDELLKASQSGAQIRARFNERWGYVEEAFVDYDAEMSGWSFEVKDFETLAK